MREEVGTSSSQGTDFVREAPKKEEINSLMVLQLLEGNIWGLPIRSKGNWYAVGFPNFGLQGNCLRGWADIDSL